MSAGCDVSAAKHTPGPWRWEFNEKHKGLHLVGGKPQFDLTIIDFERWGMHKATMRLRDTAHDGFNLMYRVHERADWIAPQPGREHHKSWHQLLAHPDARLIEAAPDLLEALTALIPMFAQWHEEFPEHIGDKEYPALQQARAAIAKAQGITP